MYDAIIVGARCAGAPTAMLLSRQGYRILLVDKASFPSDTISTHIVWPHGSESARVRLRGVDDVRAPLRRLDCLLRTAHTHQKSHRATHWSG